MMNPQKSKVIGLITLLVSIVMIFVCFTTACRTKSEAKEHDDILTDTADMDVLDPTPTPIFRQYYHRGEPKQMSAKDGLNVIENLGLTPDATFSYEGYNEYFDDEVAIYKYYPTNVSKGIGYCVFSSDKSIASFDNRTLDMSIKSTLSESKLMSIAIDYAKKLWDNNDLIDIAFSSEKTDFSDYSSGTSPTGNNIIIFSTENRYHYDVKGIMADSGRPFLISLNGKGELYRAYSFHLNVDFEKGCTLEDAKQKALVLLKKEVHVTNIDNITLVTKEMDTSYVPIYVLKYEYRSENPSYYDFDYDCEVQVRASDGERVSVYTKPITSNIDVYQIDETEQMAKEYIVQEKYGLSDIWDRFTTLHKGTMVDDYPDKAQITYSFSFLYSPKEESDKQDENIYTITVTAEGVIWDIGG